MKTEQVLTKHGGLLEIIVPDDFSLGPAEMSSEEMIAAANRYMHRVYAESFERMRASFEFATTTMQAYAETLDIMNDPEAMEAIRESREEMSDSDSAEFHDEQIRGCRP